MTTNTHFRKISACSKDRRVVHPSCSHWQAVCSQFRVLHSLFTSVFSLHTYLSGVCMHLPGSSAFPAFSPLTSFALLWRLNFNTLSLWSVCQLLRRPPCALSSYRREFWVSYTGLGPSVSSFLLLPSQHKLLEHCICSGVRKKNKTINELHFWTIRDSRNSPNVWKLQV